MKPRSGIFLRLLLAASLVIAGLPAYGVISGTDTDAGMTHHVAAPDGTPKSDSRDTDCGAPDGPGASDCHDDPDSCCSDTCQQTCSGLVMLGLVRLHLSDIWLPLRHSAAERPTWPSRTPDRLLRPPRY